MLNVAVLIGRLTATPELQHTRDKSIPVTSFSIAVDRNYQNSQQKREADFIDVVAWHSTAEFVCKYFCKGQLVAVEGSIQTRNYTDKKGNKRKAFEIVADRVHFAGAKPAGNDDVNPPDNLLQEAGGDDFAGTSSDDDLPF